MKCFTRFGNACSRLLPSIRRLLRKKLIDNEIKHIAQSLSGNIERKKVCKNGLTCIKHAHFYLANPRTLPLGRSAPRFPQFIECSRRSAGPFARPLPRAGLSSESISADVLPQVCARERRKSPSGRTRRMEEAAETKAPS